MKTIRLTADCELVELGAMCSIGRDDLMASEIANVDQPQGWIAVEVWGTGCAVVYGVDEVVNMWREMSMRDLRNFELWRMPDRWLVLNEALDWWCEHHLLDLLVDHFPRRMLLNRQLCRMPRPQTDTALARTLCRVVGRPIFRDETIISLWWYY